MEVQREELCGRQCTLLIFKINLKDTRGCKECFEVWKPDLLLSTRLFLSQFYSRNCFIHKKKHARGAFGRAEVILVRVTSSFTPVCPLGCLGILAFVTGRNKRAVSEQQER